MLVSDNIFQRMGHDSVQYVRGIIVSIVLADSLVFHFLPEKKAFFASVSFFHRI
jgi:hypothetical protein